MVSADEKNHSCYADLLARIAKRQSGSFWTISRVYGVRKIPVISRYLLAEKEMVGKPESLPEWKRKKSGLETRKSPRRLFTGALPGPGNSYQFANGGCNIATYMNVATGQIFQGMRGADLLVAASLEEWLERWLDGEELQCL